MASCDIETECVEKYCDCVNGEPVRGNNPGIIGILKYCIRGEYREEQNSKKPNKKMSRYLFFISLAIYSIKMQN